MTTPLAQFLDRVSSELLASVSEELMERHGAAFAALGVQATRRLVAQLLTALREDLEHGGWERTQRTLKNAFDGREGQPCGLDDLRLLITSVRSAFSSKLDQEPDLPRAASRAVEDVLFQAAFQIGLWFIAQREGVIEKQAGELELRLAELEAGYIEKSRLLEQAEQLGQRLDSIVANVQGLIWEVSFDESTHNARVTFVSNYVETLTGYTADEWLSTPGIWLSIVHPDERERVREKHQALIAAGGGSSEYRWTRKDGGPIDVETRITPIKNAAGVLIGLRGITMDITARKQAEEAESEARRRDAIIRRQAERLAELSTPLIPINDEVMVMPLIGGIDAERAQHVIETLLQGIERTRASVAILDITGVPSVDSNTADVLLKAARSVRLLGAEIMLTGIRPEVAQTFVTLGIDLSGIVTKGTLQSGIGYAMRRQR